MKKLFFIFTLIVSSFVNHTLNAQANPEAEIEKLIVANRDALNASDENKVVSLYTRNGVLLANAAPTAEGAAAVNATYQYVF